jgi:hypothetical protein
VVSSTVEVSSVVVSGTVVVSVFVVSTGFVVCVAVVVSSGLFWGATVVVSSGVTPMSQANRESTIDAAITSTKILIKTLFLIGGVLLNNFLLRQSSEHPQTFSTKKVKNASVILNCHYII